MASHSTDPSKRLVDRSPADIVRGVTRTKVVKELSLWVVAVLSAGAGALGMQLGGAWAWSFLYFAVTLVVLMFIRSQVLSALTRRSAGATADALAAERRAEELAAARRREERDAKQRDAGNRAHKPRTNPYRKKGD